MNISEKYTPDSVHGIRLLLTLSMALWLVACASSQRVKEDTPPPSHDPWNATALLSVLWMQDSAEYEAIAWQTYNSARRQLKLSFATGSVPDPDRPPAVILDIDETVLLNTPFAAWLLLEGKRFDVADWTVWCKQEAADAVPGSVEFVRYLGKLGIHIVYITNRSLDVATATRSNLSRLGLTPNPDPDSGNVTYYFREDESRLGNGTVTSSKKYRLADAHRRFRVLQIVGDKLDDFVGETEPDSDRRKQLTASEHARWGKDWFMLPNPVYGAWLDVLLDHWQMDSGQAFDQGARLLRPMNP